jgi:hypothetical protein
MFLDETLILTLRKEEMGNSILPIFALISLLGLFQLIF